MNVRIEMFVRMVAFAEIFLVAFNAFALKDHSSIQAQKYVKTKMNARVSMSYMADWNCSMTFNTTWDIFCKIALSLFYLQLRWTCVDQMASASTPKMVTDAIVILVGCWILPQFQEI